jgi:hypothetical protein
MAEAVPNEKLRQYLRELTPEARALLAAELERALLRGDDPPGASLILEELRSEARDTGRKMPARVGNPQRLFFAPVEPFLVDDAPDRKHRGRIARACLDPIWAWISRDLMPQEAKTYADQVGMLLAANELKGAEQVARAFQDLAEQRMREVPAAAAKSDIKTQRRIAAQIGTPSAIDDVREISSILRVRDALAVMASRLPLSIGNLADEQLDNAKALLESPIGRHRDVFLYGMLLVMSRLSAPWQLIRLAVLAAGSDAAARIAETPFAVAVEIVLGDVERMIATLRNSLRAGDGAEISASIKDLHDAARALRTELDLSSDTNWSRQISAVRAEVSKLLQAEIENVPAQVRRVLRPRPAKETGVSATLDAGDVAEIETKLVLAAALRNYAGELAISEATRRVHSELQNFFDTGTQVLIDRLRTSPPEERTFRQSQVDAAVRFCAKMFGADFASLLAKAADVAAKGEQKGAKPEPKAAKA